MSNRSEKPARRFLPRVPLAAIFLLMIPAACGFDVWRRYLENRPLIWEDFSAAGCNELLAEGHPVIVHFTMDCGPPVFQRMQSVETPRVERAIKAWGGRPLLAYYTVADPVTQDTFRAMGLKRIPALAIYPAGKTQPIVLEGEFTEAQVLVALKQALQR